MNVVMTSTDALILQKGSPSAERMVLYGKSIETLFIVIAGVGKREETQLSDNVRAIFAGGSSKRDGFSNMVMECRRIIESATVDVISAQDPFFVGLATHTARRGYNIPLQIQIHSDIFSLAYMFEKPRRIIEILVSLFVLQKASCVRLVSERTRKAVRMITKAPVSVLPIQVARQDASLVHARPAEFPEGNVVLVASRLMPEKKIDTVIDAVAGIPHISLVIAGDGAQKDALQRRAHKKGVADRVHFVGWQKSLAPLFAHANVFVQMSRYEGFGMSLLESALAGCPIIATNAGLAGDIFQDKEHLTLVERNASSLRNALTRHFSNEAEAKARAQKAQTIARGLCVSEDDYREQHKKALLTCLST
ncbi:hypothetical protein COU15_01430 [Candidatus Kaiserbacteria bacterium CG10_big_fil_rev_8_21_14_0_10_45_20]|uniref:Glycosyl transferase family 1 domain-containing protein n=1 Tax=Candidatus Kaiserbacteria bacterium CG10_big_fil_rev_8_21_14_0_10_45_20 TaxID=1974607 RepID=A0A2H0UFW1_9BACT|nr:MAG: hypothetical protein COU15_01430 [Candidatus Kaiserbacteria bacterium CG10_big_fil_rev_8_21_14_0_10_45_20]